MHLFSLLRLCNIIILIKLSQLYYTDRSQLCERWNTLCNKTTWTFSKTQQ